MASEPLRYGPREDAEPSCRVYRDYLMACRHSLSADFGGYVGLPLALLFAEKGFAVLGFDVNPVKVETLERGDCYIRHFDGSRMSSTRASGRFQCTSDFARLNEPDAILICVPTPLTPHREPDLRYIESTTQQIKERLSVLRCSQGALNPTSATGAHLHLQPIDFS